MTKKCIANGCSGRVPPDHGSDYCARCVLDDLGPPERQADKWCYSGDEETFHGACASREAAITEAIAEGIVDFGASFWIGRQVAPVIGPDYEASDIEERMNSRANDEISGDWAEDWPPHPEKGSAAAMALDALVEKFNEDVQAWAREHCPPTWFSVEDVEEFIMPTPPETVPDVPAT